MKKLTAFLIGLLFVNVAFADNDSLNDAIVRTRSACSGISDSMANLKKIAGINTALTGFGTVAGGVAFGTGIAKANIDQDLQYNLSGLQQAAENQGMVELDASAADDDASVAQKNSIKAGKDKNKLQKKSKVLGHIRTGTLAVATAADTAGAVLALKNRLDKDLQERVNDCMSAVKELRDMRLRARFENIATDEELEVAESIDVACSDWKNVDLSVVNKRAVGAAVSGGTGAAMALAGTITSATANSDAVREDGGQKKEQNLNTASNVLAGGATAASVVATVFNATQIKAIKKIATVADQCEEALR